MATDVRIFIDEVMMSVLDLQRDLNLIYRTRVNEGFDAEATCAELQVKRIDDYAKYLRAGYERLENAGDDTD